MDWLIIINDWCSCYVCELNKFCAPYHANKCVIVNHIIGNHNEINGLALSLIINIKGIGTEVFVQTVIFVFIYSLSSVCVFVYSQDVLRGTINNGIHW